jgi:hypothetical protein
VLGVAKRIDQITAYRVDPPLPVDIRYDLRDPDDSARGLVLVEVPVSAQAPHMVDPQDHVDPLQLGGAEDERAPVIGVHIESDGFDRASVATTGPASADTK